MPGVRLMALLLASPQWGQSKKMQVTVLAPLPRKAPLLQERGLINVTTVGEDCWGTSGS